VENEFGPINVVFFDFGGVVAEEGFLKGLQAIGTRNGLDPDAFFETAAELVYETGYVTGKTDEHTYWQRVKAATGISGQAQDLREEILSRFVVRHWMIELVRQIRPQVRYVSMLSDQTDWLEMLDKRYGFSQEFSRVHNSYDLGKGKRDPTLFQDMTATYGVAPSEILFVDDSDGHIGRARAAGWTGILFRNEDQLKADLRGAGLAIS
jgi:putative hydrolase of the HAD superfamily